MLLRLLKFEVFDAFVSYGEQAPSKPFKLGHEKVNSCPTPYTPPPGPIYFCPGFFFGFSFFVLLARSLAAGNA